MKLGYNVTRIIWEIYAEELMIQSVSVRNITIGEGIPKICSPIVANNRENIISEAKQIKDSSADIVEWRVDFFDEVKDGKCVNEVLLQLREVLGEMPILFTFRTANEGGNMALDKEAYIQINEAAIESGLIDMVDVEVFMGDDVAMKIVNKAHVNQVKVIGSNHDFNKTPEKQEIIDRLRHMQSLNVDIPKIAVMPNSKLDVLELLAATSEMMDNYADRPIITMSMGKLGVISRLAGETFGSAVTFGAVSKISAPGQIKVDNLKNILEQLH